MKRKRKTAKKKTRAKNRQRARHATQPQLQQVAMTTTGELFQPTRLHYAVYDPIDTERTLLNLECMDTDPVQQRWVWLYTKEASHIPLQRAPADDPIVIGEFFWDGDEEIVLNVRSIERALAAIEFFDHYLPCTLAKLTHVTMINRLFSVAETMNIPSLQALFEQTPFTERDPDILVTKLLAAKEKSQTIQEHDMAIAQIVQELMQCPEPEMEKFPAHYDEDGIASLRVTLHTQQAVAVQHWQGNTAYTSYHAIQDMLKQSQQP